MGSAIAYAGGDDFLTLPDRGPNAVTFDNKIDQTASYINRFETFNLRLEPNIDYDSSNVTSMPFVLTPTLRDTTLLSSPTPLVYGTGAGLDENDGTAIGSGVPALNAVNHTQYFTGRSDNFDPSKPSSNTADARLDTEGIRVSNDGMSVFVSDEFGPYVYQFNRFTGQRIHSFTLPAKFFVTNLSPVGATEIAGNTAGRVANKGMEGLAITPDGKTLVGAMQSPLIQDGGTNGPYTRIVTIDLKTGQTTHEYAYQLDNIGSSTKPKYLAISEIVAVNDHQFLVDERDGSGLEGSSPSPIYKKLYEIDLTGATDVSSVAGAANLAGKQVSKTLFLDVGAALSTHLGGDANVPSKIEGVAFGKDVVIDGVTKHTMFVTNDNDFVTSAGGIDNPNFFFVFAFTDNDLPLAGSYVPQQIKSRPFLQWAVTRPAPKLP